MVNIQDLKNQLQKKLGKTVDVKTGGDIQYINWDDPNSYLEGPDWFEPLTGIKGLPVGFVTEFYGRPDSGKTSTLQYFLVAAQKRGWITILIDAEKKFSYDRLRLIGGNPDDLLIISKDSIEESFDALEKEERAIREIDPTTPILVGYDSIAVGASQAELEKEATDKQTMADQAKVIKRMIRRQLGLIYTNKIAFVVVNQCYARIGSPGQQASGGQGLEYAKALSLQFTKRRPLEKQVNKLPIKYGIEARVQCEKNHLMRGETIVKFLPVKITATENAILTTKRGVDLSDVDDDNGVDVVEESDE